MNGGEWAGEGKGATANPGPSTMLHGVAQTNKHCTEWSAVARPR
ncbi:hypothetical protein EV646_12325 [Kribbella antiqua]|uniref:Uncharacterized protein n=1 Tax=Kribbella antiqua TaxID=2512217 RepID=A0A4R2I3L6_9ACTN|nr:hypothetical protein EV646_12325 [Kribbella antiqua]